MKLTNQQINLIQNATPKGSIYYNDIKEEMIDHISSKVEDLIESGIGFDDAFGQVRKEINFSTFQRQLLIASHLGFFKKIFLNLLKGSVLLKATLIFAVCLSLSLIFDYRPEEAEKHIKTMFVSSTIGLALMGLWAGLLKNSQVMSAGNSLWLILCISQILLDLDFLVWIGLAPIAGISLITFLLSSLYISGLIEVVHQAKKLKAK